MSDLKVLSVQKRAGLGKGANRRARQEELIPGVFYTAKGENLKAARANAYEAVNWITFDNKYYRNDIGKAIDEA